MVNQLYRVRRITFIKNVKMSQNYHFNPAYPYITIRYMTKLILQFLCFNETCRMIGYSLLLIIVKFVEIGFEWL